jgi:hypothetical protein
VKSIRVIKASIVTAAIGAALLVAAPMAAIAAPADSGDVHNSPAVKAMATASVVRPARSIKPDGLPACAYSGLIESDIGNYLTPTNYPDFYDYSEETLSTVSSAGASEDWCVEQATGESSIDGAPALGYGGYFILPTSYNDPNSVCLDASTDEPNTQVWLYTCNGSSTQVWCWNGGGYLVPADNTSIGLKDENPYTVIEAEGNASKWYTVPRNKLSGTSCP